MLPSQRVSVIAGLDYWTAIILCTANDNDVIIWPNVTSTAVLHGLYPRTESLPGSLHPLSASLSFMEVRIMIVLVEGTQHRVSAMVEPGRRPYYDVIIIRRA